MINYDAKLYRLKKCYFGVKTVKILSKSQEIGKYL